LTEERGVFKVRRESAERAARNFAIDVRASPTEHERGRQVDAIHERILRDGCAEGDTGRVAARPIMDKGFFGSVGHLRMKPLVAILRNRAALALLVATAAGLAIGFFIVPRAEPVDDPNAKPPEVRLLGRPLVLDDDAHRRALETVRAHVSNWFFFQLPEGKKERTTFGRLGVKIDKVRLTRLVRDARDPTSPLRRTWARLRGGPVLDLPLPLVLDSERATEELLALKDAHDRLPVDARLDFEKRQLVPEVRGRLLDVDATLVGVTDALVTGKQQAPLVFEERRPRRVAADLGNVEFDQVLGYFETSYDRAAKAQARTYNLRLAASKLDGYVLMPGETFDFNDVVGPRDEANGYKVASVIAQGELVDGIGGGTCQISGTLHGAAFFAGLEIVERYPHTRPSSYIKMGLDATVVYPTINLRVKNPYASPVVLHETVQSGVVRAEILGKRQEKTVTLVRRITEALPFDQVERSDERLPRGVRILSQRGVPGFKLRRYRVVRDGDHAVRQRWDDLYPATTQIVRLGTGSMSKDSVKAADDPHPEYVADELLDITQGPDFLTAGEWPAKTTLEERDPGRFGRYGWTKEAGMPVWEL
jgi:vancomycin resistance protein YoaR